MNDTTQQPVIKRLAHAFEGISLLTWGQTHLGKDDKSKWPQDKGALVLAANQAAWFCARHIGIHHDRETLAHLFGREAFKPAITIMNGLEVVRNEFEHEDGWFAQVLRQQGYRPNNLPTRESLYTLRADILRCTRQGSGWPMLGWDRQI